MMKETTAEIVGLLLGFAFLGLMYLGGLLGTVAYAVKWVLA